MIIGDVYLIDSCEMPPNATSTRSVRLSNFVADSRAVDSFAYWLRSRRATARVNPSKENKKKHDRRVDKKRLIILPVRAESAIKLRYGESRPGQMLTSVLFARAK
ncbi:hypothetical protein GWI33_015745 [Rhynchophorus ferrugineus]|uniref:Uncharacterized protein n=1 Tax=Rhynchophorus ferrugineus TaxID=354439 RepID=A0A834I4T7_RHYFE|nr:hypothetical protein GWI33_015745 [Rhynchophorus ferrugineus]